MPLSKTWPHVAAILPLAIALLLTAASARAAEPDLGAGDIRMFAFEFTPQGFYPCDGAEVLRGEDRLIGLLRDRFGAAEAGGFDIRVPKLPGLYSAKAKGFEDITACQEKAKTMVEEFRAVAVKTSEHIAKAEDAVAVFNRINQYPSLPDAAPAPGVRQKTAATVVADADLRIKSLSAAIDKPLAKEFDAMAMSMAEEAIHDIERDRQKLVDALKDLPVLMASIQEPKGLIDNKRTAEQLAQLEATRTRAREAQAGIKECTELLEALEAEFRVSPVGAIVKISPCISAEAVKSQWFVGEIRLMAFNFDPKVWAPCDGRLIEIVKNTAFFALLGTRFGGDGTKTFALPVITGPDAKTGKYLQYYIATAGDFPKRQ